MPPAPAATKRPNQRKRNRKRKRRNLSSSSSSSEISSSESENDKEREVTTVKLPQKRPPKTGSVTTPRKSVDESSDSDSESDVLVGSGGGSDSGSESEHQTLFPNPSSSSPAKEETEPATKAHDGATSRTPQKPRVPSPRLENVPEPKLLDGDKEKEEALRARFRQFWLGCVADAFADDLDEIRKEPNLTPARLSLLIDSLAAGANVYSSSSDPASTSDPDGQQEQVNEMEIVLGE